MEKAFYWTTVPNTPSLPYKTHGYTVDRVFVRLSPITTFFSKYPLRKWVKMLTCVSRKLLQQLFISQPTTNREKIYKIMITTQKHLLGLKIPLI